MKIALAQLNYHIGNFDSNVQKIIRCIKEAEEKGAELVVFAELAISGYPPRDFLEFDDFIERCSNSINEIAKHCTKTAAIVGLPTYNKGKKGKPLFNSAAFIREGKIEKYIHKSLLPNYDIFDVEMDEFYRINGKPILETQCRKICSNTVRCRGYTYEFGLPKACSIKKFMHNPNMLTGLKTNQGMIWFENSDIPGYTTGTIENLTSVKDCENQCVPDPICHFATFNVNTGICNINKANPSKGSTHVYMF